MRDKYSYVSIYIYIKISQYLLKSRIEELGFTSFNVFSLTFGLCPTVWGPSCLPRIPASAAPVTLCAPVHMLWQNGGGVHGWCTVGIPGKVRWEGVFQRYRATNHEHLDPRQICDVHSTGNKLVKEFYASK